MYSNKIIRFHPFIFVSPDVWIDSIQIHQFPAVSKLSSFQRQGTQQEQGFLFLSSTFAKRGQEALVRDLVSVVDRDEAAGFLKENAKDVLRGEDVDEEL